MNDENIPDPEIFTRPMSRFEKLSTFGVLYIVFSIGAGFILSFIPWGKPDQLHGEGVPFPVVIWAKDKGSDIFLDYVAPHSLLLNMAAVLILLPLLTFLFLIIRKLVRRKSKTA